MRSAFDFWVLPWPPVFNPWWGTPFLHQFFTACRCTDTRSRHPCEVGWKKKSTRDCFKSLKYDIEWFRVFTVLNHFWLNFWLFMIENELKMRSKMSRKWLNYPNNFRIDFLFKLPHLVKKSVMLQNRDSDRHPGLYIYILAFKNDQNGWW